MTKNPILIIGIGITIFGFIGMFVFNYECLSNSNCAEVEKSLLQIIFSPITAIGGGILALGIWQRERKRNIMPANGPVDINRQTLHAIIPGLDTKAIKQINKVRELSIIGFSIIGGVGLGGYCIAHLLDQLNLVTAGIVVLITTVAYLSSTAYLVRKWSKEWNKKF